MAAVVTAGLAGAAVDLVYASSVGIFVLHRGFARVWQGVASGWLGPAARDYGWASTALGLITHLGIATCMAAAYALAATRLPALYRRPLLAAPVYGLILYGVMYGGVLPLRFGHPYRWDGLQSVADILAHMGVALAIALVLSRKARVAA